MNRAKRLRQQSLGITDSVGVSCNPNVNRLPFNKDFVFWKDGYISGDTVASNVYLTISSILQNLREKPFTNFDKDSLFQSYISTFSFSIQQILVVLMTRYFNHVCGEAHMTVSLITEQRRI